MGIQAFDFTLTEMPVCVSVEEWRSERGGGTSSWLESKTERSEEAEEEEEAREAEGRLKRKKGQWNHR